MPKRQSLVIEQEEERGRAMARGFLAELRDQGLLQPLLAVFGGAVPDREPCRSESPDPTSTGAAGAAVSEQERERGRIYGRQLLQRKPELVRSLMESQKACKRG